MNKLIVFACLLAVCYGAAVPAKLRRKPVFSNSRIVGGQNTDISEVPYQVAVEWDGFQFCGGSIISETHILTARHCADGFIASQLTIRTGSSKHEAGGTLIQVKRINRNPDFDQITTSHNVATLELEDPISLNNKSAVIELAEKEPKGGDNVIVSGWGTLSEGGETPDDLQSVMVPIVDRAECEEAYANVNEIDATMICGGDKDKGPCQGDSGSPVVLDGKQVGIVSWSLGCARAAYPGIYTNVVNKDVRDFIRFTANV